MNIHIASTRQNDYYASLSEVRAVWAAVTNKPNISVREAVRRTGVTQTRLHHILKFLERAGYIEHEPQRTGRKVIMPLVTL